MQNQPARVGDLVRARRQRWRVASVRPYGACALLTLIGTAPGNRGSQRSLLTPFDDVEVVDERRRLLLVPSRRWRRRLRTLLAAEGSADALHQALRARIDLLPYQLEPALAVVQGRASRVLIADEVGLGKTIQAGLILSELVARGAAERALILTPAGLREQWASELVDRFGLSPVVADLADLRRRSAALPAGTNPWSTEPLVIASLDYVKRPEVLPSVTGCRWDIVVIDEAHGVGPETDRHAAVSELCRRAPYVVLLSATPHNGDRRAFTALCGLGELQDRLLVFRRTRLEASVESRRRVHRLRVRTTRAEAHMHALLARITRRALSERSTGRSAQRAADVRLVLGILHKRAFSSASALERSVRRRLAALPDAGADVPARQLTLPLADAGGEFDAADEAPAWSTPVLDDVQAERTLLLALADRARAAGRCESKLEALRRLMARCRRLSEPVIVFTEYRDTLMHLRDSLGCECQLIHGGLNREERRAALEAFCAARSQVLLATDAAGEGLNLQHAARIVINLEMPWNPVRLEQRIGRVDRIGQRRTVHAFHLIGRATGETRILDRLCRRVETARQDIGSSDPVGMLMRSAAPAAPFTLPDTAAALRLAEDAGREHARLRVARSTMASAAPRVRSERARTATACLMEESSAPLLSFARHRLTRLRLGAHLLVLLRTVIDDGTGRPIASCLTPLRLPTGAVPWRDLPHTTALISALEQCLPEDIAGTIVRWVADASLVHNGFWLTKLARELAIAETLASRHAPARQPGLFDRRSEETWLTDLALHEELRADADRYVAFAEAAMQSIGATTRVALVLVP